jgi:hypothetical protein
MSAWAKVAIKSKGRILFIDPRVISTVEAEGNCVLLQHRSGPIFSVKPFRWSVKSWRPMASCEFTDRRSMKYSCDPFASSRTVDKDWRKHYPRCVRRQGTPHSFL